MSGLTSFLPQQSRPRKYAISLMDFYHLSHSAMSVFSASMEEGFVIDHRKLKERMRSIVRSKEGCV